MFVLCYVILFQSLNSSILAKTFLTSIIGFQCALLAYIFTKNNSLILKPNQDFSIYLVYISLGLMLIGLVARKFVSLTALSSLEAVTLNQD